MSERILFYRTGDAFGELSNFAAYPITLDGVTWPTSEHYFQANKFLRPEDREAIRREPSPMRAAKMGRDRSRPLRPDWEEVKEAVMLEALRASSHSMSRCDPFFSAPETRSSSSTRGTTATGPTAATAAGETDSECC